MPNGSKKHISWLTSVRRVLISGRARRVAGLEEVQLVEQKNEIAGIRLPDVRYRNHDGYVVAVAREAHKLQQRRLLLPEDVQRYIDAAQASDVLH
jgi:hypothetical protein